MRCATQAGSEDENSVFEKAELHLSKHCEDLTEAPKHSAG